MSAPVGKSGPLIRYLLQAFLAGGEEIDALFDRLVVDGLVNLAGVLPRAVGSVIRPWQSGRLHGYALGMVTGIGVLLLVVWLAT